MTEDLSATKKSLIFWAVLIVTGLTIYYLSTVMSG